MLWAFIAAASNCVSAFMWNCHLQSSEVHIYHYLVCPKTDFKPNTRPFQIGDRPWDFVFFIRKPNHSAPHESIDRVCFSFAVALGSSNHHQQRLALSMWRSIVLNLKRHKSQVLSWWGRAWRKELNLVGVTHVSDFLSSWAAKGKVDHRHEIHWNTKAQKKKK